MMRRRPTLKQMIQSEIQESKIARSIKNREDIDPVKLWHAPGVPTVFNAVNLLAPLYGITPVSESIRETTTINGQVVYVATVKSKRGNQTRYGAAISQDKDAVGLLAYRNAVRQWLEL